MNAAQLQSYLHEHIPAWSLLHVKPTTGGYETRLVIQRDSMSYGKPVLGYFTAHAKSPEPAQWQALTRMLERKGRGRISASSTLIHEGEEAERFEGEFVALGSSDASRAASGSPGQEPQRRPTWN